MEEIHPERRAGRASVSRTAPDDAEGYGERDDGWELQCDHLQFPHQGVLFVLFGERGGVSGLMRVDGRAGEVGTLV